MPNSKADQEAVAVEALSHVLTNLGFSVTEQPLGSPGRDDLAIETPNGDRLAIEVKARAVVDPAMALRFYQGHPAEEAPITVIVADRISEAARQELNERHLSWYDLRGHLRLSAPSVYVDVDTDPAPSTKHQARAGIRGRAGLAFAIATLLSPDDPPTIRGVARDAQLSAPSISTAAASIRRAELIDPNGRPLLPDLFWATAEVWTPEFVPFGGELPREDDKRADRLGIFGNVEEAGWAATGPAAAAAWGAPMVAHRTATPYFYVPDAKTFARAQRLLSEGSPSPSCYLAVAPSPAACRPRRRVKNTYTSGGPWLFFTRPLFVALELANDPARGREILEEWTPSEGPRVW